MLRTAQAVATHLEKFPRERAVTACLRARHYGSTSYGAIKSKDSRCPVVTAA